MSQKCDRGVDPEFRSDPKLMSTDPLTMKGFEASADVGWPMNHVANRVSAGPSAMEVMADHWLSDWWHFLILSYFLPQDRNFPLCATLLTL